MTSAVVTVAGAKGGVGKTTTALNLAAALAGPDRSVAVVEMDLAMANFVDFLSLSAEDGDTTLHDVLAGDADPFDAVYPFGDHVAAVPSGTTLDGYAKTDMDEFPRVIKRYAMKFDLVVVDTGAGLNRSVLDPIGLADGTVVVSTPRVSAIRDGKKTVTLSRRVDTPVLGLVLTQSGTGDSPGPAYIADFLDVDLLGHVPADDAVPSSQDQGVPVVTNAPDSPAGTTYEEIAGRVRTALLTQQERTAQGVADGDARGTAEAVDGVDEALQNPHARKSTDDWELDSEPTRADNTADEQTGDDTETVEQTRANGSVDADTAGTDSVTTQAERDPAATESATATDADRSSDPDPAEEERTDDTGSRGLFGRVRSLFP